MEAVSLNEPFAIDEPLTVPEAPTAEEFVPSDPAGWSADDDDDSWGYSLGDAVWALLEVLSMFG